MYIYATLNRMGALKLSYYHKVEEGQEVVPIFNLYPLEQQHAALKNRVNCSPFGVTLHGRDLSLSTTGNVPYDYGFNGKIKDDEIKDGGNSYDFGARMYDPRVGRFLSMDAYAGKFVSYSPYLFAGNTPIRAIDNNGDSTIFYSAKGVPLGYANDNQRYEGFNMLVIIEDKDVDNFNKMYKEKRALAATLTPEQVEAHVAGLEAMGKSFDINAFVEFFNKYQGQRYENGKPRPIRNINNHIGKGESPETKVEWTVILIFKKLNELDKKGSVTICSTCEPYSDNQEASVTTDQGDQGAGRMHTHSPDGNPLPSKDPDHKNADTKEAGTWQIVVADGIITFYRDNAPNDVRREIVQFSINTRGQFTKQKGL